jgi:hypothetical protein
MYLQAIFLGGTGIPACRFYIDLFLSQTGMSDLPANVTI